MGILSKIVGLSGVARDVGGAIRENTEVFHANETEKMKGDNERFQSSLEQYQVEFANAPQSFFGQIVDGLNRLPRPLMALGTIGLFIFALYDPERFSVRMIGLQEVPEQLWWLMGAIVSFYFGARELHYLRTAKSATPSPSKKHVLKKQKNVSQTSSPAAVQTHKTTHSNAVKVPAKFAPPKTSDNPAIQDWIESLH